MFCRDHYNQTSEIITSFGAKLRTPISSRTTKTVMTSSRISPQSHKLPLVEKDLELAFDVFFSRSILFPQPNSELLTFLQNQTQNPHFLSSKSRAPKTVQQQALSSRFLQKCLETVNPQCIYMAENSRYVRHSSNCGSFVYMGNLVSVFLLWKSSNKGQIYMKDC